MSFIANQVVEGLELFHARDRGFGKTIYVASTYTSPDGATITGASTNDGSSPFSPLATLDSAVALCVANRGDEIIVLPTHAENLSGADGVDLDVAGITVTGISSGGKMPTFSYTNAAGEFVIGAAGVKVRGLKFLADVTAVTHAVDIETTATDVEITGCVFDMNDTGDDFIIAIEVGVACNRLNIHHNQINAELGVAGAAVGVKLVGASVRVNIQFNEFFGDFSTACINGITTLSKAVVITDNIMYNADASEPFAEMLTGTTGVVARNVGYALGATVIAQVIMDAGVFCENYIANTVDTVAVIKGAAGTADAD